MGLIELGILLLVASVCGSIGASIAGRSYSGCFTNIILGFIGAMIGRWLSRELNIDDLFYFHNIPILWSVVGSALFVAAVGFLTGSQKKKE
ncbi:GlsB/YeaQ/YmgE family stress response membrane protein [bacterium]|nr:GlsB/YeaQ/YmgE family stress response membrane protein [bacterium]